MAEQGEHGIAWTERTWNPIRGCTRVSEGCRNCYAEKVAGRFSGPGQPYEGLVRLTSKGPVWTGDVRFVERHLNDPFGWRSPQRVFVNSMSDLFHERMLPEWIGWVCDVMERVPRHTYQVLTKRPQRMRDFLRDRYSDRKPPAHIWWGTSVEDQQTADERIPFLLETPAAVRWISAEPLLGMVNLHPFLGFVHEDTFGITNPESREDPVPFGLPMADPWCRGLDWVVVGGESGPGARPMRWENVCRIVDECENERTAVFVKQLGTVLAREFGCKDRKGGDPSEWPEELRVREYPKGAPVDA